MLMIGLCRKIGDEAARLKCYDAIGTQPSNQRNDPSAPKPVQEWAVSENKSPIDDSPEISATLMSDDGESALMLRCKERATEALVAPKGLFASETGTVLMRLNDLPPVTAQWTASTTNKALFAPSGINFVKMLPDDGTLFVRATGWRGQRAADATFRLGAVSAVREKISVACKWQSSATANAPKASASPLKKGAGPVNLQPAAKQ
ncbi:hypothetical protein GCM10007858_04620 [Bradyrhizobium liaoningense]|nr:hypothetical protein GCM10007858_04620 [Bradyrhizobium liaoningense]